METMNLAKPKMFKFSEKRGDIRTRYKVPVIVEDSEDGFVYRGRMINYSEQGMYLETDVVLDLGAEIYIGMEDSPYNASSSKPSANESQFFLAEIKWQRQLNDNFFNFGYGVNILAIGDQRAIRYKDYQSKEDLRKHPRKSYSKPVFFTSQNQYYKGLIYDICKGGMFIKTKESFSVGQIIRLVIPGTKIDNGAMLRGKVVRFDNKGVGVKFLNILRR